MSEENFEETFVNIKSGLETAHTPIETTFDYINNLSCGCSGKSCNMNHNVSGGAFKLKDNFTVVIAIILVIVLFWISFTKSDLLDKLVSISIIGIFIIQAYRIWELKNVNSEI